jgi:hypothetical protein
MTAAASARSRPERAHDHALAAAHYPVTRSEASFAQVDPDHEAPAAHRRHLWHRCDRTQQLAEQAYLRLQSQERLLGAEDLEARQRRGAAERVARRCGRGKRSELSCGPRKAS